MRVVLFSVCCLLLAACRTEPDVASPSAPSGKSDAPLVITNARLPGGAPVQLTIAGSHITAVGAPGAVPAGARTLDAAGRFVAPAVIDAHVHLAYLPKAEGMARAGVAAAVDLAAPLPRLSELSSAPLWVVSSGPMITPTSGYPTQGWGHDGYGLEVDSSKAAAAAVDQLLDAGAGVIKVPVASESGLSDDAIAAVTARAHARGVKVVAHALGDEDARRAALGGVDALAHTPVEPLSEATLEAWRGRAVISTLSAFGGAVARENLKQLAARDVTVLYGTDFGNTQVAGISARELEELSAAGLSGSAVLAATSEAPAAFFGLKELGQLEPGRRASLLLIDGDPSADPSRLARPALVVRDGVEVR